MFALPSLIRDLQAEVVKGVLTTPSRLQPQPLPPQWINADLRSLDVTALGKFHVVVADPPWAIHQEVCRGAWILHRVRAFEVVNANTDVFAFPFSFLSESNCSFHTAP